ncbi:hypothetical protein UFOVP68_39 [uncultured Caudovirales phage]|uniref:Uncharacterized protein n=1 Tax=uncultured Caudovirales phage TaxID=2100421 RepID=A0A6J5KYU0_9CAUD|nr:hypothetical protein UFOVP68_39 [uncultured Caudovirales phage]
MLPPVLLLPLAYAVLCAVAFGAALVLPQRLIGLAVPLGCLSACVVLAAAVEAYQP